MRIYICDFIDPSVNQFDSFVIEAVDENEAKKKAIDELKTYGIPKRYIINVTEAI